MSPPKAGAPQRSAGRKPRRARVCPALKQPAARQANSLAACRVASWSAARMPTNGGCQTTTGRRIMAAVQIRVGQLLSTSRATQATRRSCCRAAMQCCKYGWQQCKCKAPPWALCLPRLPHHYFRYSSLLSLACISPRLLTYVSFCSLHSSLSTSAKPRRRLLQH
jgi:hypothetical protein